MDYYVLTTAWLTGTIDFLNETSRTRWIGRGGSTAWPLRSHGITLIDFWGGVKDWNCLW